MKPGEQTPQLGRGLGLCPNLTAKDNGAGSAVLLGWFLSL